MKAKLIRSKRVTEKFRIKTNHIIIFILTIQIIINNNGFQLNRENLNISRISKLIVMRNRMQNLLIKRWISITRIAGNSRNNLIALMCFITKNHPSTLLIFTKIKSGRAKEGLRGRPGEDPHPREARIKTPS